MINLYNHSFSADYANEERGVKEQQHNLLIALDLCRSGCHFFVVSVTIEHDWNKLRYGTYILVILYYHCFISCMICVDSSLNLSQIHILRKENWTKSTTTPLPQKFYCIIIELLMLLLMLEKLPQLWVESVERRSVHGRQRLMRIHTC